MNKRSLTLAAALFGCAAAGWSCTPAPKHEAEKVTLNADAGAAMVAFKSDDPSLQMLLDKSVGCAVFPEVSKAGLIAGGSYGNGEVYEGDKKIGYADITQATFGLQAGAQTFSELVIFLRPQELATFKENNFSLTGNVSAVASKAGAAGTSDTSKGVIVFVRAKGGLMAEASVGGQRFRFTSLAAATQPATQPSK